MLLIFLIFISSVSIIGLFQTLSSKKHSKWLRIHVGLETQQHSVDNLRRMPLLDPLQFNKFHKVLRIAQITDPHLGPMMNISRLQLICKQIVELNPDLVLLTGDYFTVEAHSPPQNALLKALEPLKPLADRTFACLGNHDLEKNAFGLVKQNLKDLGIRLLIDEEVIIQKDDTVIQLIGMNYYGLMCDQRVPAVCKKFPPKKDAMRLILLHDPTGFKYIPEEDNSLVFSGHTHGGQIGLLSLGLPYTLVGVVAGIPDHGFWGNGTNRLYVHRGQGSRNLLGTMVVRAAVPPEDSIMHIHYN